MTKDVIRFIDDRREEIRRSFNPLFGSEEARREWQGLQGREREDAIVGAFSRRLREIGGFRHVVTAIVLHPTKDRTHFHLVYATRSDEGLRTFRGVERSALAAQRMIREAARRDARIRRTGQGELFAPGDVEAESYVDQLRARHHAMARETVFALLETRRAVPYDELEVAALLHPMTSTKDVKGWLKDWKDQGWVAYEGLAPREQVPKPGKGHRVLWLRMPSGGREGGGAR
jgi:hypothetical protein